MAVTSPADASIKPISQHVSDPILLPFLHPTFDPADYLNSTLPLLSLSGSSKLPRPASAAGSGSTAAASSSPLAELSSQTQTLLSQLNALTTRLSTVLTQLTDDILRSGGRLAYQVEVLRGEALTLSDSLNDTLRPHIQKFSPDALLPQPRKGCDGDDQKSTNTTANTPTQAKAEEAQAIAPPLPSTDPTASAAAGPDPPGADGQPTYISDLRTLVRIRERLTSVISLLDSCLRFPLAPSSASAPSSLPSSLISVSAPTPDPSSDPADAAILERKARDFTTSLHADLRSAVASADTAEQGRRAAAAKVDELRALLPVWKGTVEEKPRARFVDALDRVVDDAVREREAREKEKESSSSSRRRATGQSTNTATSSRLAAVAAASGAGAAARDRDRDSGTRTTTGAPAGGGSFLERMRGGI